MKETSKCDIRLSGVWQQLNEQMNINGLKQTLISNYGGHIYQTGYNIRQ